MKKALHFAVIALTCAIAMFAGGSPAHAAGGDLMIALGGIGPALAATTYGGGRLAMSALERKMGRFMKGPEGHGDDTAAIVKDINDKLATATDKVKGIAEDALGRAEKGEKLSQDAKDAADQALTELNGLKASVGDLAQKFERLGEPGEEAPATPGARFVADEKFKAFAGEDRPRGRVIVDVKDISSLETNAAGSVGALVQAARASAPPLPQRRMTIRALIAPGSTNSNLIEFDREKVFTNNAAPVAEGAAKPQSEIQYEEASAPVRTIAHWMRTSVQILADAPGLQSIIDQRLRYGLAYREEVQLLNGDGTGQNLNGLVTQSTAFAAPGGLVADTMIDTLRLMSLQVALAEYPANGYVLNPIDWAYIEMLKDDVGRYIIGQPQGSVSPTLWGLPVIATQAMAEDKALCGAFDLAAQIFDRQNATVEVSTEDQDNFIKNKVTIRAEERLALAVYRPQALVYGDLGRVA